MKRKILIALCIVLAPTLAYAATCPTPTSLGDSTTESIGRPCGNNCEPTVQAIMSSGGYSLTATTDQKQYQSWTASGATSFSVRAIANHSAYSFVFGYYINDNLATFVPVYKTANISGYESVPLSSASPFSVSNVSATSIGFAIRYYWGTSYTGISATRSSLNATGEDMALVYDASTSDYLIAFEDSPGGDYDYNDLVADVLFLCSPTCSVTLDSSAVNQSSGTYVRWSSATADSFYISNIGYVSSSGSSWVAPSVTTSYSGTASNAYGSTSCSATLTVHPSCTLDGQTITHGSSITAYANNAPAYGSSCTSQTRTCTDGTLSGSYAYASCTVADPLSCTLDGATLAHGESASFYTTDSVSGGICSSYAQSRTCSNGTLSGEDTYTYASCSCVAAYTCSGQTIQYTNTSCSTSNVTTCVSPNFCSTGAAACLNTPPSFNTLGSFTGHLEIRPAIVPSKGRARVHWNLSNVESCSVTGDNGDSWTGASSGVSGQQTAAITQKTSYTLACTGLDGSTIEETQILNILPKFNEG